MMLTELGPSENKTHSRGVCPWQHPRNAHALKCSARRTATSLVKTLLPTLKNFFKLHNFKRYVARFLCCFSSFTMEYTQCAATYESMLKYKNVACNVAVVCDGPSLSNARFWVINLMNWQGRAKKAKRVIQVALVLCLWDTFITNISNRCGRKCYNYNNMCA